MFGLGFTEILMIAVVAILFLGPDKLPEAMVQVGKFIKSFKKTIDEAKSSFEEEIHIRELKEEALQYRRTIEGAGRDIEGFKNSIPNPAQEIGNAVEELKGDYLGGQRRHADLFDDFDDDIDSHRKETEETKRDTAEKSDTSPSREDSVTKREKDSEVSIADSDTKKAEKETAKEASSDV
jgi:sec-independent protein translocase protein TatB